MYISNFCKYLHENATGALSVIKRPRRKKRFLENESAFRFFEPCLQYNWVNTSTYMRLLDSLGTTPSSCHHWYDYMRRNRIDWRQLRLIHPDCFCICSEELGCIEFVVVIQCTMPFSGAILTRDSLDIPYFSFPIGNYVHTRHRQLPQFSFAAWSQCHKHSLSSARYSSRNISPLRVAMTISSFFILHWVSSNPQRINNAIDLLNVFVHTLWTLTDHLNFVPETYNPWSGAGGKHTL